MISVILSTVLLTAVPSEAASLRSERQAERLEQALLEKLSNYAPIEQPRRLAVPAQPRGKVIPPEPYSAPMSIEAAPIRSLEVIEHDIEELLAERHTSLDKKVLVAFTVNDRQDRVGYILQPAPGRYEVYNHGELVHTAQFSGVFEPMNFRFTSDGLHLVHQVVPDDLYVDSVKVSQQSQYVYHSEGMVIHEREAIVFPDGNTVRRYYPTSQRLTTLFYHPGKTVTYVRSIKPGDYYYSVYESDRHTLYRNGSRHLHHPLTNPYNFHLSPDGAVYSFSQARDGYILYKNSQAYFKQPGQTGFIFTDPELNVWHVGVVFIGREPRVKLYKNRQVVTDMTLYNSEGAMAFLNDSYAIRVADSPKNSVGLRLLKDGHLYGPRFDFGSNRDFNGLHFSTDGTVVMRNFNGRNWHVYADGRNITQERFSDVWHFRVEGDDVHVWGTK